MSDASPRPASSSDRRARLKRRLVGGFFTALLAIEWGMAQSAVASAPAPTPEPKTTLAARADDVRAALPRTAPDAAPLKADQPAQPWGNAWLNWGNGWNNWSNAWNNWNNWSNGWNNWTNGWNNWHKWNNAWYNA